MAVASRTVPGVGDGLDLLDIPSTPARSRIRRLAPAVLAPLAAAAFLLAVWVLAIAVLHPKSYVLPSPADVWATLKDQWSQGSVLGAVWTSVSRGALGYGFSVLVGTPVGLLLARVRLVRLALGSLISALQTLPSVTWVPVGLIWFGPTETTIYFVVVMGALPSIVNGMVHAVDLIPPLLLRVGRSMGARRWHLYRSVILPAAMPGYVAGLRQAWSFSWRSLMAAELITRSQDLGFGLGQLLDSGRETVDMSLVLLAIALILVVGLAVDAIVFNPLDKLVRSRRGLVAEK